MKVGSQINKQVVIFSSHMDENSKVDCLYMTELPY